MYPKLSKATIHRHAKKVLADKIVDKRKHNNGRPRKISPGDKSFTMRQVPNSLTNAPTSRAI